MRPRQRYIPDRTEFSDGVREFPRVVRHLHALRCAVAVASSGSSSKAADIMHLSQSAIARSILRLEQDCRVPLFERGPRGMLVTEVGRVVVRRAVRLLENLRLAAVEACGHGKPQSSGRDPLRFAETVAPSSLQVLVAVAATGSERRAAKAIGTSQPAVHRSIRVLQERLGALLFQSSPAGTRLTKRGDGLLRGVKLALAEGRALESELAFWRGELRGRVVIGALPLSITTPVATAIDKALARHSDIEVRFVEATYDSLIMQLRSGDIDMLIGALREAPAGVRQVPLFEDDLVVVARNGHPCLADSVTLRRLREWEWIVPLPGTPASHLFERAFSAKHLPVPRGALQASSVTLIRSLVPNSDRLAYCSRMQAAEDVHVGRLCIVQVDLPHTGRMVGVAIRDAGEPSPDVRVILEVLRATASDVARQFTVLTAASNIAWTRQPSVQGDIRSA